MAEKKKVSIVSSCFNEEQNLWELYDRLVAVMDKFPRYDFECVLADNGSTDHTADVLRAIAEKDARFKVIINARNFGPDRSGYYLFRLGAARGDCVITMVSDLQDPPETIADFLQKWEEGYKVVLGVKGKSRTNPLMHLVRKGYYRLIRSISEVEMVENYSSFGLYDKAAARVLRMQAWPPPYLRGLVSEVGFEHAVVPYTQDKRKHGKSSYTFLKLFDTGIGAITSFSKVPLRVATLLGMVLSGLSFAVAVVYLVLKLMYWEWFPGGMAPLVIGFFCFMSVLLLFIGLLGEYILQIFEYVKKRPLVVEKERINFEEENEEEPGDEA